MGLSPSLDRDELVIEDLTLRLMEEAGERRWDTRIVPSQPGDAIAKPYPLSASGGFGASERHMKADGRPSDPTHHAYAESMDTTRESVIQPAPRITYLDYSVKVKKSKGFRIGGYSNSRIGGGSRTRPKAGEMTFSGGLITDAARAAGVEGDGLTPPAGVGPWSAATNLVTNGGFETDATGTFAQGGGTTTVTRVTDEAKFGSASMRAVTDGNAGDQGIGIGTATGGATNAIVVSPSTAYTFSGWAKGTGTIKINVNWYTSGGAYISTSSGTSGAITLSSSWSRLSRTFNSPATAARATMFFLTSVTNQAITFYVDGVQAELGSIATPYIETDGSTESRTAGRVQVPVAGLFTATQGAVYSRFVAGANLASATEPCPFSWWPGSGNPLIDVRLAAGSWQFRRRGDAGATSAALIADTPLLGESLGVLLAWTSTLVRGSLDGAAFVETANENIPTLGAVTMADLGTLNLAGTPVRHLDSNFRWFATFSGTLTDADAAALNALGDTPPTPGEFIAALEDPSVSKPTLLWDAVDASYTRFLESDYAPAAVGGGSPSSGVEQFVEYGPYLYGLAGTHTVVINPDLDTPTVVESRFHGNAARARSGDRFNTRLAVALGDEVEAEVATSPYAEERPTAWETAAGVKMSVYQRGSAGRLFSARGERAYSVLPGRDPAVALNYNPSNGEEITDPSDPVRAMREFAAALVAGTARTARTIDPDRGYQSVALIPESRLSASERDGRAMIVVGPQLFHATTQGVNILTLNAPPQPVGPEELENNDTPFKGGEPGIPDYTGKFIAWPYHYPATGDSVIFLMRRRRPDEPGTGTHVWYDHLYLEGRICRSVYFWGGSATRGPRLFFDAQTEANSRQVGWVDWDEDTAKPALSATLTYPMDDFGQPGLTLECERIEFPNVEGADASNYGVWKVKPLGGSFVSLVSDQTGAGNPERITDTGYQQVFMPNASIATASGKGLQFRCEVTQATGATTPVRFRGNPLAYIAARPAHVQEVTAVFDVETERTKTAEELKAALEAKFGRKVLMQHAPGNTDTYIRLVSVQTTEVEVRGAGGDKSDRRIGVSATFRQVATA